MSRQNQTKRNAKDKQRLLKIGDNIRTIRKQRGYSQEEFADIAGFSRSYYTEIETGKRNISVLNLIKIVEALKVDPDDILGHPKYQ
ncbi:MAG: helix-turn-helix transcriptional regulator [Chloroflexota bacterium]